MFNVQTNKDVTKHLNGAIQLMKLRDAHSRQPPMARPIHRIIWESLLYQAFRQTVNRPFSIEFEPDIEFCTRAEEALGSLAFPDASPADNSPVIGFPLSLQKLIIEIVRFRRSCVAPDEKTLQRLSSEVRHWESIILAEGHCLKEEPWSTRTASGRARMFHEHSTSLHVLAASLLLDWTVSPGGSIKRGGPIPARNDAWQVRRGLEILRCPQANEEWSRCFLGSWPALIFGYAVDTPEDIALIRNDLQRRADRLCSGEEVLILQELESVWRRRNTFVDWIH